MYHLFLLFMSGLSHISVFLHIALKYFCLSYTPQVFSCAGHCPGVWTEPQYSHFCLYLMVVAGVALFCYLMVVFLEAWSMFDFSVPSFVYGLLDPIASKSLLLLNFLAWLFVIFVPLLLWSMLEPVHY